MTTTEIQTVHVAKRSRGLNRTLWATQIVLSLFFLVAAAGPKLVGESHAVQTFDAIGAGQWFRYAIGAIELAGAIGLLLPRLAGLAALGITLLMVGAVITQIFVLDSPSLAITPLILGIMSAWLAYARRDGIKARV